MIRLEKRSKSEGNALFLILIAVALFAALSYAVTQSGRGSGSVSKETLLLDTSRVIQYAGSIQSAIQRLQLINKCTDNGISFAATGWISGGFNFNYDYLPDIDSGCKVFSSSGGGVAFQLPPKGFSGKQNYFITGEYAVTDVGTSVVADPASSELMFLAAQIPLAACIDINNKFGVTNTSGMPPVLGSFNGAGVDSFSVPDESFHGTYRAGGTITGNANELSGKLSGCVSITTGSSGYWFYHVLIVR